MISLQETTGLLDYQVENATALRDAVDQYRGALDASDTGTGKTYTICAVMRERGEKWLVVCPKAVRSAWHRVAAHFGGEVFTINYEALKGKTEWGELRKPDGYDAAAKAAREASKKAEAYRLAIIEDDKLLADPACTLTQEERAAVRAKHSVMEYRDLQAKEQIAKKTLSTLKNQRRFVWDVEIPGIVFDEAHRCKAPNSINAKMLIAAKRQNIPVICASATAAQSPLDMKALGYVLGLHNGVDFWKWCKNNGCKPSTFGGFQYVGGVMTMRKIHQQIFPSRGVRTRIEELGDRFPETQISAELYDLEGSGKIDLLYAEMDEARKALLKDAETDKDLDHPLTQLLRARQEVEILKVPLFQELAEDAVAEGMSVAIFINFNPAMDELLKRLKCECYIRGEQSATERDAMIAKFQSGESRIIVCNIRAGGTGVSLHDLDGTRPRLALISPTYSAQDLVQVLGRVWRQGGKSKSIQRLVLAAKTVEEQIRQRFNGKLNNISMLNDGDIRPIFK